MVFLLCHTLHLSLTAATPGIQKQKVLVNLATLTSVYMLSVVYGTLHCLWPVMKAPYTNLESMYACCA